MADQTVVGLTLVKINNVFELDVKNATWDDKRETPQHSTGKGLRTATGLEKPSGSFDEVIPRDKATNWRSLKSFSIEILDKEGKTTIAAFTGCNWNSIGGSSDSSSANTGKKIGWIGEEVPTI